MAGEGRGRSAFAAASRTAVVVAVVVAGTACASHPKMVAKAPIEKRGSGLGASYRQDGQEIDHGDMVAKLEREPKAAEKLDGHDGFHVASILLGAAGGACIGWTMGEAITGDDPPWVLGGVGVGLALLSLPAALAASNKVEAAVDAHNASLRVERALALANAPPVRRSVPSMSVAPRFPGTRSGAYGDLRVRAVVPAVAPDRPADEIQAQVIIDGRSMGVTPFAASLGVGAYDVVVRHPDGRVFRRSVVVHAGDAHELRAEFRPPPTEAELQAAEAARRAAREAERARQLAKWQTDHAAWQRESARADDERGSFATATWITAGAGVALAGTGVFFGIKAKQAHDDARSAAATWAMTASEAERVALEARIADRESTRDTDAVLGASFLAAGGVSLAASLVLLVVSPGVPEEPVKPMLGRGKLGVVLQGRL